LLLPHDWFACCYSAGRRVFETVMVGSEAELARFWEYHERRPEEWRSFGPQKNGRTVPYAVYGDDAGVFQKSKANNFILWYAYLSHTKHNGNKP